ncbi:MULTISPECIES: hypothetical protein [Bacillus]|uniref:hypothetical protein n=1 Tax=Bacillus TaxID=1386 RepID=UPI000934ACCB|nr:MULTISPECIES: hypothetical protein [Bacillus]MCU5489291.1 hypothetical protein [Bacillus cereus]MDA1871920.1 hypothetical protein [Bacillus cereus]OPA06736.1 hypothetical protein BHL54_26350 [Bacillus cereus]PFA76281.1 hypothetical protein CN400_31290 [Bacillus thuringiensis]PFB40353.1 hypothetical protein CN396_27485 [Bacillus thuringiensis]
MKLNTMKLEVLNKEENEKVNGGISWGDVYTAGQIMWDTAKYYSKGKGPAMEAQYKYGMPGGKW